MDEKTAWNIFELTGKVNDYINYTNLKKTLETTNENNTQIKTSEIKEI